MAALEMESRLSYTSNASRPGRSAGSIATSLEAWQQ